MKIVVASEMAFDGIINSKLTQIEINTAAQVL